MINVNQFIVHFVRMTHIKIAFTILAVAAFIKLATQTFVNKPSDDFATQVQSKIANLENTVLNLIKANKEITDRVEKLEEKNQGLEEENRNLEKRNKDIDDELDYLKELSKLAVVRTCDEMAVYGINKSGFYVVDPDGPLIGEKPITVYCEFIDGLASTKMSHDSEERTQVQHCEDPGCYSKKITYDAPLTQIQSLINLSDTCSQEIKYECYEAPL